ncbi:MAG TPA: hypothetical protein VNI77_04525 [Nitrososphaera sp.]|nr:hypothetical protein [Nitrososphaera sp.]
MINKFALIIAGIVAIMTVLIAVPRTGIQPGVQEADLTIEYSRQDFIRLEDGRLNAIHIDDLVISNDRSATYRNLTGGFDTKHFTLSSEELGGLKRLIFETGFMQLPGDDYSEMEGLDSFTRYRLILSSGENSKTITWVNLESSAEAVPSIVRNIGTQLDQIIERNL